MENEKIQRRKQTIRLVAITLLIILTVIITATVIYIINKTQRIKAENQSTIDSKDTIKLNHTFL